MHPLQLFKLSFVYVVFKASTRFSLQLISTYATESTQDREIQKMEVHFQNNTYVYYLGIRAIL